MRGGVCPPRARERSSFYWGGQSRFHITHSYALTRAGRSRLEQSFRLGAERSPLSPIRPRRFPARRLRGRERSEELSALLARRRRTVALDRQAVRGPVQLHVLSQRGRGVPGLERKGGVAGGRRGAREEARVQRGCGRRTLAWSLRRSPHGRPESKGRSPGERREGQGGGIRGGSGGRGEGRRGERRLTSTAASYTPSHASAMQ